MGKHEVRKSLALNVWKRLKVELKASCRNVGRVSLPTLRFRARVDGMYIRISHSKTKRFVSLAFDPDTPCIVVSSHGGPTYLTFRMAKDGREVNLFDPDTVRPVLFDDIVSNVTKYLTFGV